ncbi:MAG: hypothetical protein GY854_30445 [Deltaproteobacteria bacterium]|nr:hypothetical protein [Deltaproteobacteria bacterium]
MGATAKSLFNSVPEEDTFNLYTDGQVDGKKVVDFLKYKKKDVAVATGISTQSVRYDNKMPAELAERLTEWAVAINLVGNHFKDAHKTILWFQTINPLLGNVSPQAMIKAGRFKKLLKFIQTALDENAR